MAMVDEIDTRLETLRLEKWYQWSGGYHKEEALLWGSSI